MPELTPAAASPAISTRRYQTGSTMMEIVVSLLVLSVGILGAFNLHLNGLRMNQGTYLRAQAMLLAADMAERMRANRDGALAGHYTGFDTTGNPPPEPQCQESALGCSPAEMADIDKLEWRTHFAMQSEGASTATLPGGKGSIRAIGTNSFTITVNWLILMDNVSADTNGAQQAHYNLEFVL